MRHKEISLSDIDSSHEYMKQVGFSDIAVPVAALAATLGGKQILKFHGASSELLQITRKSIDDTQVTIADRASEEEIIKVIKSVFPSHRINAEEFGDSGNASDFIWHVDPLDGTYAYLRQHHDSTVGIVLYKNEEPQVAAICNPYDRVLQLAERERGAYSFPLSKSLRLLDYPKRLQVSSKTFLDRGLILCFDSHWVDEKSFPHKVEFMRILNQKYKGGRMQIRTPGSSIAVQALVAAGLGEFSVTDLIGGPFDILVGGFMIEQAGGKFTGLNSEIVTARTTKCAFGSNGLVHDDFLEIANRAYQGYSGLR